MISSGAHLVIKQIRVPGVGNVRMAYLLALGVGLSFICSELSILELSQANCGEVGSRILRKVFQKWRIGS